MSPLRALAAIFTLLVAACGSAETERAEPIVLRGEAASLLGDPEEALSLLARLHADRSIAWPEISESDRIGLPKLDPDEGHLLLPPGEWAENLPLVIAESIGSGPPGPLGPRLLDPTFARLLRSVLLWNEAHVDLLRGRLAYGVPTVVGSEKAAVLMTVAALRGLPSPDSGTARSALSDYLERIGARPPANPRAIPPAAWDRREEGAERDWDRLAAHLGWLAQALEKEARPLDRIVEKEVRTPWQRSLQGRRIATGGSVATIPFSGDPISAIDSDPDGGVYLLRGGSLEAVTPDGGTVVVFSGGGGLFRPDLFAVTGEGEFLMIGEEEAMRIRFPEKSVRRLERPPWAGTGSPRAIAVGPEGGFFAAVGREVFRIDADGGLLGRHDAGGEIGGIAFLEGTLYASLSRSHRLVRLTEEGFETFTGRETPGLVDGRAPSFRGPRNICVTASGSIGVADLLNHAIREVRGDGSAVTVAGAGSGLRDGPAGEALFSYPFALTSLPGGGIVVAEKGRPGLRVVSAGERIRPPAASDWVRPPREVYAGLDRGRALARGGDAAGAAAAFDRAIEGSAIDPNLKNAFLARAAARSALEQWEGAAADFERAAELSPGSIEAGMGRARALLMLDRPAEACTVLDGIGPVFLRRQVEERHRDPRFPRFHLLRARAHTRAGDPERGLEAAKEAVRAKETSVSLYGVAWAAQDADLYVERCRILLILDEPDLALADADRALELDSQHALGHAVRADALVAKRELHAAGEAYREAIRIQEGTPEAHIGLARLYCTTLDDRDKAIDHLDRYLSLGGDERTAAEILSNLTATAKDRRGAYAEVIRVDADGERYRLRVYEDGSRVKIPYPWTEGE